MSQKVYICFAAYLSYESLDLIKFYRIKYYIPSGRLFLLANVATSLLKGKAAEHIRQKISDVRHSRL